VSERLDVETIEAIAVRVAELLEERRSARRLVTAAELSERLGLARSTIYEKAGELGAIRIGTGPRARLRFDPDQVVERLGGAEQAPASPAGRPSRRRQPVRRRPRPGLLPIRGEAPR
jgi:hypothetical protein